MNIKIINKFLSIDRRIIYVLVAAVILIPIIKPLNLPVQVTDEVLGVYNEIEKLPPGSKILVAFDYEPASTPEMDPMAKALIRHCFRNHLKVVGISWLEQGRGNAQNVLSFITDECQRRGRPLKYGEDYAYMGFKAGEGAMIMSLVHNFKGACIRDYLGNDVYTMPILKGIGSLGDFPYLAVLHDDSMINSWITYGYEIVGIKIGALCTAIMAPGIYANLSAGQLTGIVGGLKGGSEYEKLLGYRGLATNGMDSQTLVHFLIIIFILIGNFAYLAKERKLRKERLR